MQKEITSAMSMDDYESRLRSRERWAERQDTGYPGRFDKSHSSAELMPVPDGTAGLTCAGRLLSLRRHGKLTFCDLRDSSGEVQLALSEEHLGADQYAFLMSNLHEGDLIGVGGEMFTAKRGRRTLRVLECTMLAKALRPLPDIHHGVVDPDVRQRRRYLELLCAQETRDRFAVRTAVSRFVRRRLDDKGFLEVQTPILQDVASGATAEPFVTHHKALDTDLFLRIAPETYLKRLMVGGYERLYELGPCFRNEGIDPTHLQEFWMVEWYAAWWDYRDNMRFARELVQGMLLEVAGGLLVDHAGVTLDFSGEWPEITYRELVLRETGIDLDEVSDADQLRAVLGRAGIEIGVPPTAGLGSLLDALYKKRCRDSLVQPVFVTGQPAALVPLARRSDSDNRVLDMFQLVAAGTELIKGYSELVDPVEQRARFEEQRVLAAAGDKETMPLDEEFVVAMEHGMPPMSGAGMGLERMIALLTSSFTLRDVVYFPTMARRRVS